MKAIILAAGKGTRFKSDKAKVLQEILGKSLIERVIDLAVSVGIKEKVIVVGYQGEEVIKSLEKKKDVKFVWQHLQLGTGHAVMSARDEINPTDDILILYGDVPATKKETIQKLIKEHQAKKNVVTILTAELEDPKWYGRIVRDKKGNITCIREAKDCSPKELEIKEINTAILIVQGKFLLEALSKLKANNTQKEYYLTDIVEIASNEGKNVGALLINDENEIKGVNSIEELQEMRFILQKRTS